jgi:hypothetical protein
MEFEDIPKWLRDLTTEAIRHDNPSPKSYSENYGIAKQVCREIFWRRGYEDGKHATCYVLGKLLTRVAELEARKP